jgi:hypothetical protein
MKKYSPHIAWSLFLLFPALMGRTQTHDASGRGAALVSAHASVDQPKILIGQPIHLLLEATVTGNARLAWPAIDSFPHFEILEKGPVDSAVRPDGRYYRQSLTVTSFDSGAWAVPRLLFISGTKKIFSDSVRVEVDFSKFDPNKDYHDIHDIIDVPNPYAKWFGWIVTGVSFLSLALVIWMVGRKKPIRVPAPPPEAAAPLLPPYEEALVRLGELAARNAWENDPAKAYYTQLNDILRLFVLRRLGIASLAETNEELIGQLRQLPLDADAFSRLAQALRMSDFVKFAKYQPEVADKEDSFRVIRSAVEGLERVALERAASQRIALERMASPEDPTNEKNTTQ